MCVPGGNQASTVAQINIYVLINRNVYGAATHLCVPIRSTCIGVCLDKKVGSFKQITTVNSVKNDLIINAFKPIEETSSQMLKNADEGLDIQFLRDQLKNLPIQPIVSRTDKMLFSKMLAYYVENGFEITANSTSFYKILDDHFIDLDGYWFLREQTQIYKKLKGKIRDN